MATALVSALTGKETRPDVAMTGEITLGGKVLPIGGLNEKAVAAHRAKLTTLIIPQRNEKDLCEFPKQVTRDLKVELVDRLDQVFAIAFEGWEGLVVKPEEHTGEPRPEAPMAPSAPH
jgi:ATP-dependent Lon protease